MSVLKLDPSAPHRPCPKSGPGLDLQVNVHGSTSRPFTCPLLADNCSPSYTQPTMCECMSVFTFACVCEYLGAVFSHRVVVETGLGPELFLALLALQGVLEL